MNENQEEIVKDETATDSPADSQTLVNGQSVQVVKQVKLSDLERRELMALRQRQQAAQAEVGRLTIMARQADAAAARALQMFLRGDEEHGLRVKAMGAARGFDVSSEQKQSDEGQWAFNEVEGLFVLTRATRPDQTDA